MGIQYTKSIRSVTNNSLREYCLDVRSNSSEQHLISRHNINNLSNTQVMRIKITINSAILSHFKNYEKALKFRPEKSGVFLISHNSQSVSGKNQ